MEKEYPPTVKIYNIIQYVNIISSLIIGAGFSLWLFVGLLHNRVHNSGLNHYRDIILILSASYFITCFMKMPLLPAISLPQGNLVFLWGEYYPLWLSEALILVADFMTKYGNEILAAAIIYKVTSLVRPKWLMRMRIILTILLVPPPIVQYIFIPKSRRILVLTMTCNLYCDDMENGNTFPSTVHLVSTRESANTTSLDYGVFIFVVISIIPSVIILENWFRAHHFSPVTLKLQRKLSKAWIILMLVHGYVFLPKLIIGLAFSLPKISGIDLPLIFITITLDVIPWVIPIKTLVIFFTIRKLLPIPDFIKKCLRINAKKTIAPLTGPS